MSINFTAEAAKLRASDKPFDEKLQAIVQRDTRFQEEKARRGGEMSSELSPDAQEAAAKVQRQKAEARASIAKPAIRAAVKEHEQLIRELAAAAHEFETKHATVRVFESEMASYFSLAGEPMRPRVAGMDPDPRAVLERAQHVLARPASSQQVIRQPLARPVFSDLVA